MLFAFDLMTDLDKYHHFSLVKCGNLHLALTFLEALLEMVMVIAYAEFVKVIMVDRDCNVVLDFGV